MGFKRGKFTFEYVKTFIESRGCKLLSTTYHKITDVLEFECRCGNIHKSPFRVIKEQPFPRCLKCTYIHIQENNRKNHGGINFTATPEFQERYRKTCEEKYGVSNPMQSDTIKDKLKQTFVDKYGVEHQSQIPEVQSRMQKTKIKNGTQYNTGIKPPSSKQCQKFLLKLYDILPENIRVSCIFYPITEEFCLYYGPRKYFYDFVNTDIKLIIEFNGSRFHPTPDLPDNAIGWHFTKPNFQAKQARVYEKHKYMTAENQGYSIITVWDYEINRVPKEKVKLNELLKIILELYETRGVKTTNNLNPSHV